MDSFVPKYVFHYKDYNKFVSDYNGEEFKQPFLAAVEDENFSDEPIPVFNKWRDNGYEFVDMGFESGVLWATCNVGAETPTQWGLRVRWGEVEQLSSITSQYITTDYKWFNYEAEPVYNSSNYSAYTRYNATDQQTVLLPEDDPASLYMGGDWHLPTVEDAAELLSCSTVSYSSITSSLGCITYTSKINGNQLIFPTTASGSYHNGMYWTASLYHPDYCSTAQAFGPNKFSGKQYCNIDRTDRCYVRAVRGVIYKNQHNITMVK